MTQLILFATIAAAFFLLMLGGFLIGHDHDHDLSHGHDFGHGHGVSMFSFRVLSIFGMGFGAAGAVATQYGLGYLLASAYGVGVGLLLGFAMYSFMNLISRQQSTSVIEAASLVGATGTVTVEIGADTCGEVALKHAGNYQNYLAKSVRNIPIAKGASVMVIQTEGSQVIVEVYPPKENAL